jgi:L-asparaginase II
VPPVPLVRVIRSGFEESVHVGSVAVADPDGDLVASAGDPERVVFARSSMKPLQAAVSLTLADEELGDREVAVMCASHNGEPVHVDAVGDVLGRAGLGFGALRCPPDRPLDPGSLVASPDRRYHNCSGKHAGMLLASARQRFELATYRDPDHPLQREVLRAVRGAVGEPRAVGVDGCGVPVHALSLLEMATLFARLATGAGLGDVAAGARRAVTGMQRAPYLVAGTGRVCTAVMEAVPGVIVKVGAEGLVCAGVGDRAVGVAIRTEDGGARAQAPAVVHALASLGAIGERDLEALGSHARPAVLGGGEPVGHLEPVFELSPG